MIGASALTQAEADALIAMAKTFADQTPVSIPPGTDDTRGLNVADPNERFLLDIWRSTFRLSKVKYQTRGRQVIVLVRLDIDGAPHTNPDGNRLTGTHLHRYREGYDDKWAEPVDAALFPDLADMQRSFTDFCAYCNIQGLPPFQAGFI
jgi:hypothetical protein